MTISQNLDEEMKAFTFPELEAAYHCLHSEKSSLNFFRYKDQKVYIRGFLYKANGKVGEWVLAAEPNLRTCCIGSPNKEFRQLSVTGNLPHNPSSLAVTVQGKLRFFERGESGNYRLEDAVILQGDAPLKLGYVIAVIVLFCLLFMGPYIYKILKWKRNLESHKSQ